MNPSDRTNGADRGRIHEGTRMRTLRLLLTWMAAFGLAGCGGGGEMVARIGSGGSGAPVTVGVGTVDGFGSLVINGQHFDETAAQFRIDERPDQPTAVSVDSIRLGMQIQFEHLSNRISQATVAAEVIGPVTSVSATGLLVLGQTVLVNADPATPTAFDGISALSDLAPGAIVEVHGQRNMAGEIRATRIELRTASGVLRVAGTVSDLANGAFRIGALTVRASQAAIVPAGQVLANGQRIAVWTDLALANGELVARVVRIGGFAVPNNAALTIDGVITDFQSTANLRIGGIAVDASSAQFVGGAAADLRNGRSVRASGTVGSNVLRATRIEFLSVSAAAQVELSGPVTAFVDAGTAFRIRNAAARVSAQTTYVRGDASNLGDGVLVKAEGPMVNGIVEVARLEFQLPPTGIARVLFGTIAAPVTVANDGTRTFRLASLPFDFKTTTTTRFRKGAVTDIAAGRSVKVDGTYDGINFVADDVQFMDNAQDPPTVAIDGIASNVQPTSVVVNGSAVMLTTTTIYRKNSAPAALADLQNGASVSIEAVRLNGQLFANSVDIKASAAGSASVRGLVSGRASPTSPEFLVGSQRVSVAGNPQIVPGNRTLADIRNGTDLEVDGTIAGGLLTASRVKFR